MPSRTASEADSKFAYYFRESLSVITGAYLIAGAVKDTRILLFEPPVKLKRKSGDPLFLSIAQTYKIVEGNDGYKATTTSYSYLLLVERDKQQVPVLEFHWHPHETKNLKWPHLHVNASGPDGELRRKHFPTARIAIEDFIRFIIRDFGVSPRVEYAELKEILTRNKTAFARTAQWIDWKPLI